VRPVARAEPLRDDAIEPDLQFWRPKRRFFQKTGNSRPKSESSTSGLGRHSKIRGQVRRLRDARTSDTLQLCRTIARPLNQAVSVVSPLLAAPCIPSCGPAFDRSAASHQPGGHTSLFAPRVKLGLSTSSETSSL
jgi:hypothetical protein